MGNNRAKQTIGLGVDIGQRSAKAILLKRSGRKFVIKDALFIDSHAEGLLNEHELFQAVSKWLAHKKRGTNPICYGLPHYLTTEAITNFPKEKRSGELEKMVEYQTHQLSGISDEQLIYDYQELSPLPGQIAPVLISICRQSTLDSHIENFKNANLKLDDIGNNALALTNAFFDLHPLEAENKSLQALLDIGQDESAIALVYGGTLLHIGGINFGASRFTQAIANDAACSFTEAERIKAKYQPAWDSRSSDFYQTIEQLAQEIQEVFKHWREQSDVTIPLLKISKLWLTGGGSLQNGLEEALAHAMDCGIEFFGVPSTLFATPSVQFPPDYSFHPNLTIAYGLALQEIGSSKFDLSLIPNDMRWRRNKMNNFPFLFIGCLGIIITLLWILLSFIGHVKTNLLILKNNQHELDTCLKLIPQLDKAYELLDYNQKKMIPLAEYSYRSERFVNVIDIWQTTMHEQNTPSNSWCIYLADQFSFNESNTSVQKKMPSSSRSSSSKEFSSEERTEKVPSDSVVKSAGMINASAAAEKKTQNGNTPVVFPVTVTPAEKTPLLQSIIIGGVAPQEESRYKVLKSMLTTLKQSETFINIDDYMDFINPVFQSGIIHPWESFLRDNHSKLEQDYAVFFLNLPFKTEIIHLPKTLSSTEDESSGNGLSVMGTSTGASSQNAPGNASRQRK